MFPKFSYPNFFGILFIATFLLGGCAYSPLNYAYDTTYPGFKDLVKNCNTEVEVKLNETSEGGQIKSGLNLFVKGRVKMYQRGGVKVYHSG